MSLTKCAVVAGCFAVVLASHQERPSAGILKPIAKDFAAGWAEAAVEKLEPALARTLADADNRLAQHEERIGKVVGGLVGQTSNELGVRLGQVDGILEKRLLQVELGVDNVLDHGLDKIDGAARARLAQVDGILAARIKQVDGVVAKTLADADLILKNRIADVGTVVNTAIERADGALEARIEQLDEVAGRRLGNVDVIATKQRLGLERTITRAAWLLALVIFVVVVLKALWTEYLKREDEIKAGAPGTERARLYLMLLGKPLLRHAAVGGVVAVLLATIPQRLPMAAVKEQQALAQQHEVDLEKSVARLDWTRARFHASQLEFLEPTNASRYQALAAKAELLRDLLARPTALATTAGVTAILDRVRTVERLQSGRPDADVQTIRAMVLWQGGTSRNQEHEAASLAARALWSSPRGFTLAPMARIMVEAYLHAPAPPPEAVRLPDAPVSSAPPLESPEGLQAVLDMIIPDLPGSPFEGAAALFHLMERLDRVTAAAFVAMVQAQADAVHLRADAPTGALAAKLKARNDQAQAIVDAWTEFDAKLRETAVLASNPLVLSIFRLNDVLLTHALWFTTQDKTVEWPPRLASLGSAASDRAIKLAVAPARAVWARRYAGLLQGPARELVEMQEAQRFEAYEDETLRFEQSFGSLIGEAATGASPPAPTVVKRQHDRPATATDALASAPRPIRQLDAANAAAALGLYEGQGTARRPLALTIVGNLTDLQKKADELLVKTGDKSTQALQKAQTDASKKLHDQMQQAIDSLRMRLLGRGPRLI
jgi:hypothetical protein